ncbi:PLP-dependent aminotransferase family protein [Nocardioides zeae]|uniref:PLP-dependent aminotransferase family protein n=1 Tax=Nocardioides imazamoxiresistens TaxID=3231893 RepID=A0ABU3PRL1_9ACTN|nr:PLP-dependent aminotransferase family protein [Nocardioides zeae]MDT9591865.1 PLP-dependent aminotransferase family protein [Nocardioides zeae]
MLALSLDRHADDPLGTQLARQVRSRILDGTLADGLRLPSSRALARDLGVSRAVVEQAYAQLVAEGWLAGRRGAGTFVAASAHLPDRRRAPGPVSPPGRPLVRLDAGTPWIDPRQADLWRRAWREVGAARPPRGYDDPRGLPELRAALADRLARVRGLAVDADDVRVATGSTDGLRHVLGALGPGPVLLDDPGYRAAAETVRRTGRAVHDHPAGTPVGDLSGCAAAYVTPAHQHPLGHAMPGAERVALLGAARAAGALVVEDDYDSEFRYDVAPIPALTSLDRDHAAYLGTASKSVAPSLRLGWFVVPDALAPELDRIRAVTHDTAAWPVQRAFWALLRDGYVDRVVRAARRVYAARAERVAAAFAPVADLRGTAGMYACVELPADVTARAHAAARAAGFDVPLLADLCRTHLRHGLVVGFGGCTDAELDAALAALASAW